MGRIRSIFKHWPQKDGDGRIFLQIARYEKVEIDDLTNLPILAKHSQEDLIGPGELRGKQYVVPLGTKHLWCVWKINFF